MTTSRQDTSCWDQFWQSGRSGCCDDQRDSGSAKSIRRHWREFFAAVRSPGRILDLCTGNGEVLRLALEYLPGEDAGIDLLGIDSAAILPSLSVGKDRRCGLQFLRGSVTQLPFADKCFDRLVSQFGIEYAPIPAVTSEIMRVMAPGGRALLITHALGGIANSQARAAIGDIDELFDDLDIFAAARRAVRKVLDVERAESGVRPDDVEAARRAHENFESRLRLMVDTWQQRSAATVFRDTGSILLHTYRNRDKFPFDALIDKIQELERSVHLHRDRLRLLCESALDDSSCSRVAELLRSQGASLATCSPIMADDTPQHVAWAINVER